VSRSSSGGSVVVISGGDPWWLFLFLSAKLWVSVVVIRRP